MSLRFILLSENYAKNGLFLGIKTFKNGTSCLLGIRAYYYYQSKKIGSITKLSKLTTRQTSPLVQKLFKENLRSFK